MGNWKRYAGAWTAMALFLLNLLLINDIYNQPPWMWMAAIALVIIGLVSLYSKGIPRRLYFALGLFSAAATNFALFFSKYLSSDFGYRFFFVSASVLLFIAIVRPIWARDENAESSY